MDPKDKKLLNLLQEDFPLTSKPYQKVGESLNLSEEEILIRIKKLIEQGIIRRFGILINHKRLKYYSTLIGVKIQASKLPRIVKKLISYPEITHCYERAGVYNLWFTFLTPSLSHFKKFLLQLKEEIGSQNIVNLETIRSFKLRTVFKLK